MYIYIHAYSLLSSSQYPRLLISVQAVVFKALTVIFRDLFYLYFIKGISLQRTNKRSVPNLNVRNPVLRGYKQISCPAVKSLLLNCFFLSFLHHTGHSCLWGTLSSLPKEGQSGASQDMQSRRWMDCWARGQLALGVPKVHLSPSLWRGA